MKSFFSLVLPGLAVSTLSQPVLAERLLKAANLHSALLSRSSDVLLKRSFDLHYIEDSPADISTGAWLDVESRIDTLVLEDIEHLTESIECTRNAQLAVQFQKEYYEVARKALQDVPELFIITSHNGCNQAETRMPYRASGCVFDESEQTAWFELSEASWKEDFKMHLGFATTDPDRYSVRKHGHVVGVAAKRDIFDSDSASTTTTAALSSFAFPTAASTAAAAATAVGRIDSSISNGQILPPEIPNVSYPLPPGFPSGLTVSCIECSTTGSFTISSGYISVDSGNDNSTHDFFANGFIALQADGVGAHVALDFKWTQGFKETVHIPLPKIPLDPFAIPGIGNVGVTFIPQISLSAAVLDSVDFQYGFDVAVPDKSLANITFGIPFHENSTLSGFEDTTISALPFNSSVGDLTMSLSTAFSPQLLLGASVLDLNFGAAVFMNLPRLSVTVEQVHGTDQSCNNVTQGTTDVAHLIGNLTHITPEVDLSGGFQLEAPDAGTLAYTALSTAYTIDTACLAFQTAGSSYMPATAAFAAATASAASASGSSAAAPGPGRASVISGLWLQAGAVAMCVVLGGAVAL